MPLFWLISCGPSALDTGAGAPSDTAAPDVEVGWGDGPWSPLEARARWEGARGYGTGIGFGDFDGDGDPDLLVAYGNDMEPGPLRLFENIDGALSPEPRWTSAEVGYFGHLSIGDVDGDGAPDVAVSRFLGGGRFDTPGGIDVFLNEGGALSDRPTWSAEGFYSFSCALGDVDRDGDLDLAAAAGERYWNDPERSSVWLNDGAGAFGAAPAWESDAPRYTLDVAWLDLDGDGWLDLATANAGSPHAVFSGDGAGGLEPSPSWEAAGEGFEGNTLDWGDVDGDGWLDLAISDTAHSSGSGAIRVWCGPGLDLCWEALEPPQHPSAISLEDVDGDGGLDLVAGGWWSGAQIYFSADGALETEARWRGAETALVIEGFAWADLDGSHRAEASIGGEGLVQIPGRGRVLSITGGVAGDGWASGSGYVEVTYLQAIARDLALSDWEDDHGDRLYARAD